VLILSNPQTGISGHAREYFKVFDFLLFSIDIFLIAQLTNSSPSKSGITIPPPLRPSYINFFIIGCVVAPKTFRCSLFSIEERPNNL
jgi:hypothetical protein